MTATEAMVGIIVFAVGCAVGYWLGHSDGVYTGFDYGWKAGMKYIRETIDEVRARKAA